MEFKIIWKLMVHQWVFTNARQKLTSRHVWQGDVSGYRSLCNDYFGRAPQFIGLFDVFMAQFSCGVCTEEERFWQKLIFQDDNSSLIALPDEMTTLKLVASASQKIWRYAIKRLNQMMRLLKTNNTELSLLNLEPERLKYTSWGNHTSGPTRPSSMVEGLRAWPIVPASEPATVELCSPDEPKGKHGCKQIIQTLSSNKKTPESWSGITLVWWSREEKKIPTYLFHTVNSFSLESDS